MRFGRATDSNIVSTRSMRADWSCPRFEEPGRLRGSSRLQVHLLVVDRRLVVESGVTAPRVVPALDVLEDGHPPHRVGLEGTTVDELALEAGEEAFTQGVVVGVADGCHRGPDAGLATSLPEGYRVVSRAVIGVMHHALRLPLRHGAVESGDHEPRSSDASPSTSPRPCGSRRR